MNRTTGEEETYRGYSKVGVTVHNLIRTLQAETGFLETEACEAVEEYIRANTGRIIAEIKSPRFAPLPPDATSKHLRTK